MMYEHELKKLKELWKQGLFDNAFYKRQISDGAYLDTYDNFTRIPFMKKEDIRNTGIFERTTTRKEDIFGVFSSSGSTGEKTYYVFSQEDKRVQEQCAQTFLQGIGIDSTDIGGILSPIGTGIMAQTMMWQFSAVGAAYVNCSEPSPENIVTLLDKVPVTVVATRPEVMSITNPEYSDRLYDSTVKTLLPGGGFVTEGRRRMLEKIWNAKCYNFYGMSEVFGPVAAECTEKNGQHYPDDYLMIEVVDPDTGLPVEEGQPGIAVYTTLWFKGFPLLRYWTDDFIKIDRRKCRCGCKWPRFYYLGRRSDCFRIGDIFYFPKEFEERLFIHGIYDDYRVRYQDGGINVWIESFNKPAPQLVTAMEEYFGLPCKIESVRPGTLGIYQKHKNHFERE